MLPEIQDDLRQAFTVNERQPSLTYGLDIEKGRIFGKVDGIEAVKQAIYKILSTERYRHLIYSWNYGAELTSLIGQPASYVVSELKRRVTEALMQDDRVTGSDAFSFITEKGKAQASFTVNTIFGDVAIEKEVNF